MSRVDDALKRIAEAMSSSIRLYEAEMAYSDAVAVFRKYGVDPATLDADALKKAFRGLSMKLHPDKGGDAEAYKAITAAYSTLEKNAKGFRTDTPSSGPGHRYSDEDYPVWASAGYSGGMRNNPTIRRQDYSDMNYVKKRMWELSGKSRTEWTIWTFDGRYFRNVLSVYGNPSIFHDMADAMLEWGDKFHKTDAIFVTRKRSHELLLIWLDGEYVSPPIPFEFGGGNPGNDQQFTRGLRDELDKVKTENSPKLEA